MIIAFTAEPISHISDAKNRISDSQSCLIFTPAPEKFSKLDLGQIPILQSAPVSLYVPGISENFETKCQEEFVEKSCSCDFWWLSVLLHAA